MGIILRLSIVLGVIDQLSCGQKVSYISNATTRLPNLEEDFCKAVPSQKKDNSDHRFSLLVREISRDHLIPS